MWARNGFVPFTFSCASYAILSSFGITAIEVGLRTTSTYFESVTGKRIFRVFVRLQSPRYRRIPYRSQTGSIGELLLGPGSGRLALVRQVMQHACTLTLSSTHLRYITT